MRADRYRHENLAKEAVIIRRLVSNWEKRVEAREHGRGRRLACQSSSAVRFGMGDATDERLASGKVQ